MTGISREDGRFRGEADGLEAVHSPASRKCTREPVS